MRRVLILAAAALLLSSGAHEAQGKETMPRGLQEAYQKEYAFLTAQKRALTDRLAAQKAELSARIAAARAEVNALEARIVLVKSKAEEFSDTFNEARRGAEGQEEEDRVGEIMDRARDSLGKLGLEVALPPAKGDNAESTTARAEALTAIFAKAAEAIAQSSGVRKEPGEFFLPSGKRTKGTLLRVGSIATYGISDEGAGALAPAGQGRLKLWPEDTAQAARALVAGKPLDPLPIFLYESLDKDVEPKKQSTFLDEVRAGGTIAWVIVGIGALAILLVLLRLIILLGAGLGTDRLLRRLRPLLSANRLDEARATAARAWGSSGRVLRATLANLEAERTALEDTVAEAVLKETPRIERFGAAITVFAAVAPLLGLLGTVTGMMATFDVITVHGTGDPKLLSGGISEALITTKLGLVVAIPTLLVGTLLRGWAETIQVNMERAALHVINLAQAEPEANLPPSGGAGTEPLEEPAAPAKPEHTLAPAPLAEEPATARVATDTANARVATNTATARVVTEPA